MPSCQCWTNSPECRRRGRQTFERKFQCRYPSQALGSGSEVKSPHMQSAQNCVTSNEGLDMRPRSAPQATLLLFFPVQGAMPSVSYSSIRPSLCTLRRLCSSVVLLNVTHLIELSSAQLLSKWWLIDFTETKEIAICGTYLSWCELGGPVKFPILIPRTRWAHRGLTWECLEIKE